MKQLSTIDQPYSLELDCIKVSQPIGDFFIASIPWQQLREITFADVRRLEKEARDVETYLGIQRPLNTKRVAEIGEYVNTADACFPTSVILAVDAHCARFDEAGRRIVLSNYYDSATPDLNRSRVQIAKVLDGQHRIEGLGALKRGSTFDINVSIFIDMDIENQAYVFSTVNLAQTKVSKSLVYDLYEYARSRSPQKTCHNVAVALDSLKNSPLQGKIKRLGTATEGRFGETLTQATVVENLIGYITASAVKDRDEYLRGHKPRKASATELVSTPFRNMFLEERDLDIADVLLYYFSAVRQRWPEAWASSTRGWMLNRTNGFRALMRYLKPAYRSLAAPGDIPSQEAWYSLFKKVTLNDDEFTVDNFEPGTGGETKLYRRLVEESGIPL
ncbi:DGQHR domain-containing protein [Rubrivivax sp. A210]|uniref:DGQHR domain-containing protein n=1 Tax=Rubrivivax sp. A210 TaxID=2772301 RepID=UPI001F2C025F|nr:DGQHR domain-containing protein [Rubrivivax sp. A210]